MRSNNDVLKIIEKSKTESELLEKLYPIDIFSKLFPEHAYLPMADFHYEIHSLLDKGERYTAIAAPRGTAKTTNVSFFRVLRAIAYREERYIIIISGTKDQSVLFLQNIRNEIVENELFRTIFGIELTKDSQTVLEINSSIYIQAKGRNQKIRGRKYKSFRPTLIILDDAEDDKSTETEEQRNKVENWFFDQVMPSIDRRDGKIWVIGTILHTKSLLNMLLQHKDFVTKKYAIIQNGRPLWKEMYSLKDIKDIKGLYKEVGKLDSFYKEYMNDPTMGDEKKFKTEYIRYYTKEMLDKNSYKIIKFITIDPAKSSKKKNDHTAAACIGITPDGYKFVIDALYIQKEDRELINTLAVFIAKHRPLAVGIEDVGFQALLKIPLSDALARMGLYSVDFHPIKTENKNKNLRILSILPDFQAGRWLFPKWKPEWFFGFLNEYQNFNENVENEQDDFLDALSMINKLLEIFPYFSNFTTTKERVSFADEFKKAKVRYFKR